MSVKTLTVRLLPVEFERREMEGTVTLAPKVECPERQVTDFVARCGKCPHFQRVTFAGDGAVLLNCSLPDAS
jgi:uncharacterized protein (UPF0210 family)